MEDTSVTRTGIATTSAETTASSAVPSAEEDCVEPAADENVAHGQADEPAGQAGGFVEKSKPILPNELTDHVLSYVSSFDKPQLAVCCLVSRAFFSIARSRLYHTIQLDLGIWQAEGEHISSLTAWPDDWRLYHILLQRCYLAELVKDLEIEPNRCTASLMLEQWQECGFRLPGGMSDLLGNSWLKAHAVDVSLLLNFCRHLKSLKIMQLDHADGDDYSFVATCLNGAVLPELRELVLPTFSTVVALLAPALTALDIVLDCKNLSQLFSPSNNPPACLTSLAVQNVYPAHDDRPYLEALNWLTRLSEAALTKLSIFYHPNFHPSLKAFISLVEVTIELIDAFPDVPIWTMPSFHASLCSLPSSIIQLTVDEELGCFHKPNNLHQTFLVALPPRLEILTVDEGLFPRHVWLSFITQTHRYIPTVRKLRLLNNWNLDDRHHFELRVAADLAGLKLCFT
ncbi:hypothetical protein JCM11251_003427 [Rhodosporidiobolus azoricus]